MKRSTKNDAFAKMPNEMFLEIFYYLDFESALKARCVSKKWKRQIEASRNITVTCHLTDETVSTAVNSVEGYPSVKIYDFMKPVPVISATRGVGRILATAGSIEIKNSRINPTELMKVMRFATKTLENLSFNRCDKAVLFPLLKNSWTFECLSKLSIELNTFPEDWHLNLFERLSEQQSSFPSLAHFKVLYYWNLEIQNIEFDVLYAYCRYSEFVEAIQAFSGSLKTVEIEQYQYNRYRVSRKRRLIEMAEVPERDRRRPQFSRFGRARPYRSFWDQKYLDFQIGDMTM